MCPFCQKPWRVVQIVHLQGKRKGVYTDVHDRRAHAAERARDVPLYAVFHATVSPPSLASTSDSLTETILETPFSSMVTPKRLSAFSMVGLRWVMTMNCVSLANF